MRSRLRSVCVCATRSGLRCRGERLCDTEMKEILFRVDERARDWTIANCPRLVSFSFPFVALDDNHESRETIALFDPASGLVRGNCKIGVISTGSVSFAACACHNVHTDRRKFVVGSMGRASETCSSSYIYRDELPTDSTIAT